LRGQVRAGGSVRWIVAEDLPVGWAEVRKRIAAAS